MERFFVNKLKEDALGQSISQMVLPILPILVGSSILSMLIFILSAFLWDIKSPFIYQILNFLSGELYLMIPFLLGAFACIQLRVKIIPGLLLVASMLYPAFQEMGLDLAAILGNPHIINGMQLAILPLVMVLYLYGKLTKWLKDLIKLASLQPVVPYISLIVMVAAIEFLIYPLGRVLDQIYSVGILMIFLTIPVLGSTLLGFLSPLLFLVGFLYGDFPVTMSYQLLNQVGFLIGPGFLAACVCQGAAALSVATREQDTIFRRKEILCGILAFFTFLTPVLLVVNLRDKRIVGAGMVGGAFSGLYYGIFRVEEFTNTIQLIIGLVIGMAVTFGMIRFLEPDTKAAEATMAEQQETLTNHAQKYRIK